MLPPGQGTATISFQIKSKEQTEAWRVPRRTALAAGNETATHPHRQPCFDAVLLVKPPLMGAWTVGLNLEHRSFI